VLGASILGIDFDTINGQSSPYQKSFQRVIENMGKTALVILIPGAWKIKYLRHKYYDDIDNITKISTEIINKKLVERKEHPDEIKKKDLLDNMLDHFPEMSIEQIICNIFVFFGAGHESTSNALSWASYYFAKYPEYQKLAQEEVDKVLANNAPDHENTKQLEFLDCFLKEVLRKSPPIQMLTLPRRPTKEVNIDGLVFQNTVLTNIGVDVIHHLEEFWPEPNEFNPYRFTAENSKNRHPYAYLPFSVGKRHCIGNKFAEMEMKIFLAAMLQKFTFEYVEEPKLEYIIVADTLKQAMVKLNPRY